MKSDPRVVVVFDIGNTLVRGPGQGPAVRITERLGVTADPGLSRLLMSTDLRDAAELAELLERRYAVGESAAHDAAIDIWNNQAADAVPIDGVLDTMWALHASGVRLALLSNIWRPYVESVRRWFGPLFDEVIPPELQCLSYREGLIKPAPELFLKLLARAATPAVSAVMVGDSLSRDIIPAAQLGMHTVLVGHTEPAADLAVPDWELATAAELSVELVEALYASGPAGTREAPHVFR